MPHFATSDELSLHYELHGFKNDGTPIVFLNGMTQTTRHWATHCRKMRDRHRLVTYDARGQGRSSAPSRVPSLDTHTRDLLELLDHLEVERADLVGFSHGARIALGFAARYPDRLRKLVLCGSSARPTALAETIVKSWGHILEHGGLPALAWASLPTILGEAFLEKNAFLLENIVRASVERNSLQGTRMLLEGIEKFPPLDELASQIDAPTLVITGDRDLLASQEGGEELAELCGGTFRVVENSGHTVPIEQPDDFRRLITDFLD